MLVNGDVPFFRVSFLSRFRIFGCHLSPLRVYGYTFEKIASKYFFLSFSCSTQLSVPYEALVFRIYGYPFLEVLPDL